MAAENVFATQIGVGMIASSVLAMLKKAKWMTAVTDQSVGFNHFFLIITSAAGALGIHYTWSAASHTLTITNLDFWAVMGSLWLWWKQWAVQFLVHRGAFGPVAVKAPTSST